MIIKLSYKIFTALTLTSFLVVALIIGLIRFYVARNFTDYVNQSLLEKYGDVASALAIEYKDHKGWQVLKDSPERWHEILRTSLLTPVQKLTAGTQALMSRQFDTRIEVESKDEFGLLKIMMSQPNRVFSRNELINRVQGYDFEGYDRTIDTHIKNLRKKIAQRLPDQEIISTVYGIGYKFNASSD